MITVSLPEDCVLLPNHTGYCHEGVCLCFQGFAGKLCTVPRTTTCHYVIENQPYICLDEAYPPWGTLTAVLMLYVWYGTQIINYITPQTGGLNRTTHNYWSLQTIDESSGIKTYFIHSLSMEHPTRRFRGQTDSVKVVSSFTSPHYHWISLRIPCIKTVGENKTYLPLHLA